METSKAANAGPAQAAETGKVRRRRWEMSNDNVRYFCSKPGSSQERPELGQEMATEGEALVKAFKDGGVFYTLVAWSAVTEIDGNEPKIIKQALKRSS